MSIDRTFLLWRKRLNSRKFELVDQFLNSHFQFPFIIENVILTIEKGVAVTTPADSFKTVAGENKEEIAVCLTKARTAISFCCL